MAEHDITSANAVAILTVDNLYPSGVRLQQFAADGAFAIDSANIAEARMGVDGHLAAGYTPNPRNVTITLEANSPSLEVMNRIAENSQMMNAVYRCKLQITIPSLGKEYVLSNGVMLAAKNIPDAKKVLDPVEFQFVFESCKSSTI